MSARLYKEFTLNGPAVWQLLKELVREHARAYIEKGTPLRIVVTSEERRRTKEQNARYWSRAVLGTIAEQAWVEGAQFSEEVWHETLAEMFCPRVEFVLPDGQIFSRRKSTSEMSVQEFSDYVQRVEVYASTQLCVEFDSLG
nr:hypothetical protein HUO10_003303 [Paraburkholderia busanensis]